MLTTPLTISEVLDRFSDKSFLTRDLLYFWEKRDWVLPTRVNGRRRYVQSEVEKIGLLLDWYEEGLTPEKAYQMTQFWRLIPAKRFRKLTETLSQVAGTLGEKAEFLAVTAKSMHELMNCESGSVLISVPEVHDEIDVVSYSDLANGPAQPLREKRDAFTAWVMGAVRTTNLSADALKDQTARANYKTNHLPSGECFSFLMSPLCDRKRRVLGWLKVENRKGAEGRPDARLGFDSVDEVILEILANYIVPMIENLTILNASRDLLNQIPAAPDLPEYCKAILEQAVSVLGLDRGDLAWEEAGDLKLLACVGPITESSGKRVGDTMPKPSLTWSVFESRKERLVNDVSKATEYYPSWDSTRSEALVPFLRGGECLGVLNLESHQQGFFDQRDLSLLRYFASFVLPAAETVAAVDSIWLRLLERSDLAGEFPFGALSRILTSVRHWLGFHGGMIYSADYRGGLLRCAATMPQDLHDSKFEHLFGKMSLAHHVFKTKETYFSEDPATDPNVDKSALAKFGIVGPLIGVPLLFGEVVVGVMVVWAGTGGRLPTAEDQKPLERYARLTATSMAISNESDQHRAIVQNLQLILGLLQTPTPRSQILHAILAALNSVGFERARVFRFDKDRNGFVLLDSTPDPPGEEALCIEVDQSAYAKQTYKQWQDRDLKPTIRDPRQSGIDRYAKRLGKPDDMPWAVAPLTVGELFGYLAVDQRESRKPLTQSDLEVLGLFATLAAQAIASEERGPARENPSR